MIHKEISMNGIKNKLNKPLIILTFIFVSWLGAISQIKDKLHINSELSNVFDASPAGTAAKWTFISVLFFGSFAGVFWIKALWNNIFPRITNWKVINYWEAMGIAAFILLFTSF